MRSHGILNAGDDGIHTEHGLAVVKAEDDKSTYFIQLRSLRSNANWVTWESAMDSRDKLLAISVRENLLSHGGTWANETVGCAVTRDYLDQGAKDGISVKFTGRGGEKVLTMTADYVAGFLSRVDSGR